jgi:hypothetical protein
MMIYEPCEVRLTLDELKALCAEWQKVLRWTQVIVGDPLCTVARMGE